MSQLSGRCLCGAVTYTVDADPLFTAVCHCRDCQRQTGTSFSLVVGVPRAAFQVEGDSLSTYETIGEDAGTPRQRQFCSACGSPIVTLVPELAELAIIKAGTLDNAGELVPQLEVWGRSAHEWVPQHAERPRMSRGTGSEPIPA